MEKCHGAPPVRIEKEAAHRKYIKAGHQESNNRRNRCASLAISARRRSCPIPVRSNLLVYQRPSMRAGSGGAQAARGVRHRLVHISAPSARIGGGALSRRHGAWGDAW